MTSRVAALEKRDLITPPPWLSSNLMFEATTGSEAYGCMEPGNSDKDIVGFAIPPKHYIFPHIDGYVVGFGTPPPKFEQFQQHHIEDKSARCQYDIVIYSIVKFFSLCMANNPNMVDALFSPRRCVLHSTQIYEHLRENRRMFLHKGCWHKFRGYAYAQLTKLGKPATNKKNVKRQQTIEKYGYDTKYAYHIVRLALECAQILEGGDLILDRDKEIYKTIRKGGWTEEQIREWFSRQEVALENLYKESKLQHKPDEQALRGLLLECLEMHYGSMQTLLSGKTERRDALLSDLEALVYKYGGNA